MSRSIKKLGSDKTYKRPNVTYQEKLTAEEIVEKLQGYEKIDDILEVPLDTHIRYFTKLSDGSQAFRTGGFLHNKQNADKYIMLTNRKDIWSVQVKDSIFFRKLNHAEEIATLHEHYKKKLEKKDQIIKKLKRQNREEIKSEENEISSKSSSRKSKSSKSSSKIKASSKIPKSSKKKSRH